MGNIGYYHSTQDIGNHEKHLLKLGDQRGIMNPYRITNLTSSKNPAVILVGTDEIIAEAGMILGTNALLKTRGATVELKSAENDMMRLLNNSEFCIENTVEGPSVVVYGDVYIHNDPMKMAEKHIKYRTTCYMKGTSVVINRINERRDLYYALNGPVIVYEYDENGESFDIVRLKQFQKCEVEFDPNGSMRERYREVRVSEIDAEEIKGIYSQYLSNSCWQEKFSKRIAV